jgi:single-strand selective monofunctional uracil DNA glycosylase
MNSSLTDAALKLRRKLSRLSFPPPVAFVYQPLDYAWAAHECYLKHFGSGRKRVLFLGMNPGPFGMVQTGVPFGEIAAVRDWLKIQADVGKPELEHPKRPVTGFACRRSEVSGRRLWGLFAERFATPERFLAEHFVANYCPIAFLTASGSNLTPDKLPSASSRPLYDACDDHLRLVVDLLEPEWLIGVGDFAAKRAEAVFSEGDFKIGKVLHPSPASPAANRDWAGKATRQLIALGVWE